MLLVHSSALTASGLALFLELGPYQPFGPLIFLLAFIAIVALIIRLLLTLLTLAMTVLPPPRIPCALTMARTCLHLAPKSLRLTTQWMP